MKYEFLSVEWLKAVQDVFKELVSENEEKLNGVDYSLCEIFNNVPKHIVQGADGTLGWYFHIKENRIDFGYGDYDAHSKLQGDYEVAKEFVTLKYEGDMPMVVQQKLMKAMEEGKIVVSGNKDNRPDFLLPSHNMIVDFTLPI